MSVLCSGATSFSHNFFSHCRAEHLLHWFLEEGRLPLGLAGSFEPSSGNTRTQEETKENICKGLFTRLRATSVPRDIMPSLGTMPPSLSKEVCYRQQPNLVLTEEKYREVPFKQADICGKCNLGIKKKEDWIERTIYLVCLRCHCQDPSCGVWLKAGSHNLH